MIVWLGEQQAGLAAAAPQFPQAGNNNSTVTTAIGGATPTAASGCAAWFLVDSPNPAQGGNYLFDVEAVSPNDVWAVGGYGNSSVQLQTLVLHWNGTNWQQVPSPSPGDNDYLAGLEVLSANDIWAVGGYSTNNPPFRRGTLALHWDGTQWSIVPTPDVVSSDLNSVSAVSASDIWAVGTHNTAGEGIQTLTMHWDGTQWSTVPSPSPGPGGKYDYLLGVAALSSTDVWAVGYYHGGDKEYTLTLRWDGQSWTQVPSPSPGEHNNKLWAVTAITANDIWAVGTRNPDVSTLAMHWDGTQWSVVPSPNPGIDNYLFSVDASSSNDMWAVGDSVGRSLMLHWDGIQWSAVPGANYAYSENILSGVAIVSPNDVWAVGTCYSCNGQNGEKTLVQHYGYYEPCVTPSPVPTRSATPNLTPSPTLSITQSPISTQTATTATSTATPITGSPTQQTNTITPATGTSIPASTATDTSLPANTSTPVVPTSTATSCAVHFTDVPSTNTFYQFVRCLACRNITGGYSDGTFRPNNDITRGQLSKIVANSAGFNEPVTGQTFEDVASSNTFYPYVERMASRGIIGGYTCGGAGEPCGSGNKPYFRPNANATRGQISKIVSNTKGYNDPPGAQLFQDVAPGSTFYDWVNRLASRGVMGGYPCGGAGEPCGSGNLPYFRPANNATRGQTSKIVAGTFFPGCEGISK